MGDETRYPIAGDVFPKDGEHAAKVLVNATQQIGQPPFWRAKKWVISLPTGVRAYPEVAVLIHTDETIRQGFVMLKYKDKTQVSIGTNKLYKGTSVLPCEITEKWVVVRSGERTLRGKVYE